MGVIEEEARFLVAKYGTAAGPTGLPLERFNPAGTTLVLDLAGVMILLGFLLFFTILFVLVRDALAARESRRNAIPPRPRTTQY